jgi:transketolase
VRAAFFQTLQEVAQSDGRVNLVVGDLGFGLVEKFVAALPDQFLNAGVAEQNMTGVAAGMALAGKVVFTYSIANFPVVRCLEQIRNDVCYHNANVKIVAVGGGFSYGALGMTHHATEDLAIMRAMPQMTVVAPGDPWEVREATRALVDHPGPAYLRLGRVGEPILHPAGARFELGKAIRLRDGLDVALISTGAMLETTLSVANRLEHAGVHARVLSMHTLKPLDTQAILSAASETKGIITVEEHSLIGGLGSAVAEVLAESGLRRIRLKRCALPSQFTTIVGSQAYLRAHYGLTEDGILASIYPMLRSLRRGITRKAMSLSS